MVWGQTVGWGVVRAGGELLSGDSEHPPLPGVVEEDSKIECWLSWVLKDTGHLPGRPGGEGLF